MRSIPLRISAPTASPSAGNKCGISGSFLLPLFLYFHLTHGKKKAMIYKYENIEKISEEIKSYKGSVESIDKMGRKKLAYDVQGYRDGYFTTMIISVPAESIVEFKRNLKLNDNVLRFMFMEVSKKAQTV